MLFAAAVVELLNREHPPTQIQVTAYESDGVLIPYLEQTLRLCQTLCEHVNVPFLGRLHHADFVTHAADMLSHQLPLFSSDVPQATCVILNPPYRKINSESPTRQVLRQLGIETSNLYPAFLALAAQLLKPQGELVAITPRSFCNGPYFKHFRTSFLKTMTIRRLHLFDSRTQAFQDDAVLQETVILHTVKDLAHSAPVIITSNSQPNEPILSTTVPYDEVIYPDDPQAFIHIVTDDVGRQIAERMTQLHAALDDLGLRVSTGRVVDFRARRLLRMQPESGTAPLIWPTHLRHGHVHWPNGAHKKPEALLMTEESRPLLVPNACYILVKRFSAKEERRRVVAVVYRPEDVPGSLIGFENHLNYIHQHGSGVDPILAHGLTAFLNSTLVDTFFRQFNGHTQVNASDLRALRYPTREQLAALGEMVRDTVPEQAELDRLIEEVVFSMTGATSNDPIQTKRRIEDALRIIKALGLPRQQHNERSALVLLALLDLKPDTPWSAARDPLLGITPMMEFAATYYGKHYAPNTRETFRRQTIHQFLDAGLVTRNPDNPRRATNSAHNVYQIEASALALLQSFATAAWDKNLRTYLASVETLQARYAQARDMQRIPVTVAPGTTITLTPGGQNVLVQYILDEFAARFTPGGQVLYVGDTGDKFAYYDEAGFTALGITIEPHGKIPDVIIHHIEKNWLVLIEAVTSHGPINPRRRQELQTLFGASSAGLVFVTAFLDRRAMVEYLGDISWETEVWVADAPSHLIHFNGERFLGPY